MHVEVHFVAEAELLHQFPQLLQRIEQSHATSPIEVVWLDEPHVPALVQFIEHGELAGDDVLVLELCLYVFVLSNQLVDLHQLLVEVQWPRFRLPRRAFGASTLRLDANLLDCVKVLAEAVHLADEVLGGDVKNELDGQVLEDVKFVLLAVPVHIYVQLVLRRQQAVALQVVDHFLLTVQAELLVVDEARDRCPFETVERQVRLIELHQVVSRVQHSLDQRRIVALNETVSVNAVVRLYLPILFRHLVVLLDDFLLATEYLLVLVVQVAADLCIAIAIVVSLRFLPEPSKRVQPLLVVVLVAVADALLNIVGVAFAFHYELLLLALDPLPLELYYSFLIVRIASILTDVHSVWAPAESLLAQRLMGGACRSRGAILARALVCLRAVFVEFFLAHAGQFLEDAPPRLELGLLPVLLVQGE